MKIWIDNDACPRKVREIVFKAASRLKLEVLIVANSYMHPPQGVNAKMITVDGGFDAADDYIAENVEVNDLVITADLPLADRIVSANAIALSPRGQIFDPSTIKEKLTMRNLNQELRSAGEISGGPPAFGAQDIKKFAGSFDRILAKLSR